MKIREKELKQIFKKSKFISRNFKNLREMLTKFPQSLVILRLAIKEGQLKFSKTVRIQRRVIALIERRRMNLGPKRINRILENIKERQKFFNQKDIIKTFRLFKKINKGLFSAEIVKIFNISLKEKRNISIKALKSSPMNKLEEKIFNVLNSTDIPFEFQSPLKESLNSARMIVNDFAIPNSAIPIVLIEATESLLRFNRSRGWLTAATKEKLIQALRINNFKPDIKFILVLKKDTDVITKELLLEAFDFIVLSKNLTRLPNIIRGILNANQN